MVRRKENPPGAASTVALSLAGASVLLIAGVLWISGRFSVALPPRDISDGGAIFKLAPR